jgi:ribosomal protein L12E/L44/L45/RPP1/RPP2
MFVSFQNKEVSSKAPMTELLSKSYALAAILIYSSKKDVTVERMKSIFEHLGLEFSSKIASMFVLSSEKYGTMIHSIGSAPAVQGLAGSAPTEVEEEAEKTDDEGNDDSSSGVVFNF